MMGTKLQNFLKWWIEPVDRSEEPQRTEQFGSLTVDSSDLERLFIDDKLRADHRRVIDNHLTGIPLKDRYELIDRVLLRFALYVYDLPASQANHHARRFGLLDQSLEVAAHLLRDLSDRTLNANPDDPAENNRQRAPWLYAAFIAGLFHDVGRIADLYVNHHPGAKAWDPYKMPLYHYLKSNGLTKTTKDHHSWRKNRGSNAHELRIVFFDRLILHPLALGRVGQRLSLITESYLTSSDRTIPRTHLPDAANLIADLIRDCDSKSAHEDISPTVPDGSEQETNSSQSSSGTPNQEVSEPSSSETSTAEDSSSDLASPSEEPSSAAKDDRLQIPPTTDIVGHLNRMIGNGVLKRNSPHGGVWITPDFVWIDLNFCGDTIAQGIDNREWDAEFRKALVDQLREDQVLCPFDDKQSEGWIHPAPGMSVRRVIRFKTDSFIHKKYRDGRYNVVRWDKEVQYAPSADITKESSDSAVNS